MGIDNYIPLSDWRDGGDHLDADAGAIYGLDYLRGNIEGGEGYDWYYANRQDADTQTRTPITDGTHGEPWVWRYKDIRNWWLNPHHERVGGVRSATPTAWVPQSKPVWFTEYGCSAVDKGTNQPNKFVDPKSSESSLPYYSTGARDDLIQMQYLQAMTSYYADPAKNPVSAIYGGPMVDMSRAFVWAWDGRPYPYFPNNRQLWSDGDNYALGHWLNGRTSARPLASVVEEVCARSGLTQVNTSQLYGYVRGYTVAYVGSARATLQPLMLRYGFDAVERDGTLHFVMREGRVRATLDPDWLARAEDLEGLIEQERDPELELSGRVRLQFVQADGDYEILAEEAVLPDSATHSVSSSEVPLSLTRGEGRQTAERWLSEARVARDKLRFALPPSRYRVGAGDVVRLSGVSDVRYRIDRVEQGPHQIVEAVRIEPSVYVPAGVAEDPVPIKKIVPPVPVTPLFLDLPLMRGDEVPHAPHVAVTSAAWPGPVAVYQSPLDSNYGLNSVLNARSVIGLTQTPLRRAAPGIWDSGAPLRLRLIAGHLESAETAAILAGANLAAIGDGTPGNWELFQFARADLVGDKVFELGDRLRGQQGSDALVPDAWPAGSWFVLLNGVPSQIDMASNQRRITQHFRIGPAKYAFDDPSYRHFEAAFDGNGLRPYAPAHLRIMPDVDGNLVVSWVRRTRIEGDAWDNEVPLGEDSETYLLRIRKSGKVLREVVLNAPGWVYTNASQASDGASGDLEVTVAQVSARYGPGLDARRSIML